MPSIFGLADLKIEPLPCNLFQNQIQTFATPSSSWTATTACTAPSPLRPSSRPPRKNLSASRPLSLLRAFRLVSSEDTALYSPLWRPTSSIVSLCLLFFVKLVVVAGRLCLEDDRQSGVSEYSNHPFGFRSPIPQDASDLRASKTLFKAMLSAAEVRCDTITAVADRVCESIRGIEIIFEGSCCGVYKGLLDFLWERTVQSLSLVSELHILRPSPFLLPLLLLDIFISLRLHTKPEEPIN